ncbi:hypothetical protein PIB30_027713 [Stylosanthes scabra]|uniref:Uncharacterized protein n=1 Tax=Stylosanthes scabra TaxID=79078 RepID=A0ABU6VC51_9FABA|nr:hypothetical protein [Stylosanthes scabra]
MQNVGKLPHNSFPFLKILLENGLTTMHVLELYDLGDYGWRVGDRSRWLKERIVDNCAWMLDGATKESRVHIELGVQRLRDFKIDLLNRFGRAPSRLHLQDFIEYLGLSRFYWS